MTRRSPPNPGMDSVPDLRHGAAGEVGRAREKRGAGGAAAAPGHDGVSPTRAYVAYFLILTVLAGLLLGYFLVYTRQQTELAVNAACANEAHVITSQVVSTLRRIDATTALIADEFRADLATATSAADRQASIEGELLALSRNFPEVSGYFIFDAEGALRFSSVSGDGPKASPTGPISWPAGRRPSRTCCFPRPSRINTADSRWWRHIAQCWAMPANSSA